MPGQNQPVRRSVALTISLWALVVAWAAFIFYMSSREGSSLTEGTDLVAQIKRWLESVFAPIFGPDVDLVSSLAHFCEFAIFGAILQTALRGNFEPRMAIVLAILIASCYAVTDEIHQIFVPGRMCDPIDWLVDTAGAALGAEVWGFIGRKLFQKNN